MATDAFIISPQAAAVIALVVIIISTLFTYILLSSRRPSNLPPGPPSVPILGSLPYLKAPSNEFYKEFTRLANIYGGFFSLALGRNWVVVMNDFESIRDALVGKSIEFAGRIDDPRERHYRKYWPIRGMITSSYSTEWRNQRSYVMYLLRSQGFGTKSMEVIIAEERDALLERLVSQVNEPLAPVDIMNVSISNVICSLIFGKRYEYNDQELLRVITLLNWLATFFGESAERDFIPLLQLSPAYVKLIFSFKSMNDEIAGFMKRHIDERRVRMKEDPSDTPRDFIESYLMGLQKNLSGELEDETDSNCRIKEDWLHDIITDLFFAGAETTATTLTWAILYLVKYPDVQRKVQEELDREVGPPQPYGQVTLGMKESLPYCEATIREVQRISAIIPLAITHCTTKEVEFRGYLIPKDTQVRVNLYAALHDPETWPEPDVLRPERFLDSQGSLIKHEQWIPFSMGRRMCLGEQLAKQELFFFLTGLLHSFSLHLPEGAPEPSLEPVPGIVLKAQPFQICLKPRYALAS